MSMAATFDTLQFVEALKNAGFEEKQAKGLAMAFKEVQDTHREELATKQDIKDLEHRMTIKMGSMMMVSVGVVAALVKLL